MDGSGSTSNPELSSRPPPRRGGGFWRFVGRICAAVLILFILVPIVASAAFTAFLGSLEKSRHGIVETVLEGKAKERLAVILRDIDGRKTSEVAQILGSSETTVRSQVSRARVRMKEAIDQMMRGR